MSHRKRTFAVLAGAAGALLLASVSMPAQTMTSGKSGSPDSKFVMEAAGGGMAEVAMGKMAAEKGTDPDVQKFGQRMVDDHSKANDELKQIASSKGVTVPADVPAAEKAKMDKMAKLTGPAFDKAYMADMLADHRKDVAAFRKESTSGKDADVKAFASKTLPTLEEHLKMAEQTNARVAGK